MKNWSPEVDFCGREVNFDGQEVNFDGQETDFCGQEINFDGREVDFDALEVNLCGREMDFLTLKRRFSGHLWRFWSRELCSRSLVFNDLIWESGKTGWGRHNSTHGHGFSCFGLFLSAMLAEQVCNVIVSLQHRQMQRSLAAVVLGIDISAICQQ